MPFNFLSINRFEDKAILILKIFFEFTKDHLVP